MFAGTLQLQQLLQLRNTLFKQMYKSRLAASVVIRGARVDASECKSLGQIIYVDICCAVVFELLYVSKFFSQLFQCRPRLRDS